MSKRERERAHKQHAREQAERTAARMEVYAGLWRTPRYVALDALKTRLFTAWRHAEYTRRNPREAAIWDARYRRALRRMFALEKKAFEAAGLTP